ncbi:hypothetical protein K0U07_03355 [bacterium]|nr:hypothetical protein [bacterium]
MQPFQENVSSEITLGELEEEKDITEAEVEIHPPVLLSLNRGMKALRSFVQAFNEGEYKPFLQFLHEDYLYESTLPRIGEPKFKIQPTNFNTLENALSCTSLTKENIRKYVRDLIKKKSHLRKDPFFSTLSNLISFNVPVAKRNIKRIDTLHKSALRLQKRYRKNTAIISKWNKLIKTITEFEHKLLILDVLERDYLLRFPFDKDNEELLSTIIQYKNRIMTESKFCRSVHRIASKGFSSYFDLLVYIQDSSYVEALIEGRMEPSTPLERIFLANLPL